MNKEDNEYFIYYEHLYNNNVMYSKAPRSKQYNSLNDLIDSVIKEVEDGSK